MFNLVSPCKDCPFRNDKPNQKGWLGAARMAEIIQDLENGLVFPCHKTTTDDQIIEDEDGNEVHSNNLNPNNEFCAGALIYMELTNTANQSRAVVTGEWLGLYDRSKLRVEGAPVFGNKEDLINWHANRRSGKAQT